MKKQKILPVEINTHMMDHCEKKLNYVGFRPPEPVVSVKFDLEENFFLSPKPITFGFTVDILYQNNSLFYGPGSVKLTIMITNDIFSGKFYKIGNIKTFEESKMIRINFKKPNEILTEKEVYFFIFLKSKLLEGHFALRDFFLEFPCDI